MEIIAVQEHKKQDGKGKARPHRKISHFCIREKKDKAKAEPDS